MSDRQKRIVNLVVNAAFLCCVSALGLFLAQLFCLASFKIPSDSMEPSLVAGDYVLVDKLSTGARLFDVADALDGKEVDIFRMPGWRGFRHNDVLVFNFPYPGRWDSIAFDVLTYYVKRCVAVPGDTLEIRDTRYRVSGFDGIPGNVQAQERLGNLISSGMAEEMGMSLRCFPDDARIGWTIQEFGPLYVPAKGGVAEMDARNGMLYRNLIEWEQKKKLRVRGDTVWLGDSVIRSYRFREDYYFVSGDRLSNSQDSRYWGLLPEPFIVGRAVRIWKSVDYRGKTRWGRVWKRVE